MTTYNEKAHKKETFSKGDKAEAIFKKRIEEKGWKCKKVYWKDELYDFQVTKENITFTIDIKWADDTDYGSFFAETASIKQDGFEYIPAHLKSPESFTYIAYYSASLDRFFIYKNSIFAETCNNAINDIILPGKKIRNIKKIKVGTARGFIFKRTDEEMGYLGYL